VIACSNASGKFLSSVLIFKDVTKKEEFGDGLLPGSYVYMKGNRRILARTYAPSGSQNFTSSTEYQGRSCYF